MMIMCGFSIVSCTNPVSNSQTTSDSPTPTTLTAEEVFGTVTVTPTANGFTASFTRNASLTGNYTANVALSSGTYDKAYLVAAGSSEITVSDLTAATGYKMYLTYTGSDFTQTSAVQNFTTLQAQAINYFGNVTTSDVTPSGFTVNFTPNTTLTGTYLVKYRASGSSTWTVKSLDAGVSKYSITGLSGDSDYDYCVAYILNGTNESSAVATQKTTHLYLAPKAPELIVKKSNIKATSVTITGNPSTQDTAGVAYPATDVITYRLYQGTTLLSSNTTPDFTVYLADYPNMSRSAFIFKVVPVRNNIEGTAATFKAQVPYITLYDEYSFKLAIIYNKINGANDTGKLDAYSAADKAYYLKLRDDADTMALDIDGKTEAQISAIVAAGFATSGKSVEAGFSDVMTLIVNLDLLDQTQEYTIWVNSFSPLITNEMIGPNVISKLTLPKGVNQEMLAMDFYESAKNNVAALVREQKGIQRV